MAYALGIILDWHGPYHDFQSMKSAAKVEWGSGCPLVYLGISHDNFFERVEYVGISQSADRRFEGPHKLNNGDSWLEFWLAEPASYGKSGRKAGRHDLRIDYSESLFILALDPPLNEKRKLKLPPTCCSVVSRCFSMKDYETPIRRPASIPEVLSFNSYTSEISIYGVSRAISDTTKFIPLDEAPTE